MTVFETFPRDGYAFSALDVGEALAGLFQRGSDGVLVEGVIGGVAVSAVPASWRVLVPAFTYVERVGAAVRLSGLSAGEEHDITNGAAIPSGQARIDLVCWDASTPEVTVIEGAASSSPVAPPSGGLPVLAEVRVNSGDGMVIAGQVSSTAKVTRLAAGGRAVSGMVAKRSVGSGAAVRVPVTFPVGMFTVPPNVQVTQWGDIRDGEVSFDAVTANGFDVILGSNSSRARVFGASWRAEQL